MNWKRIGRVITCLLVVCCLIVNMSPIRAEATGVEIGLIGVGAAVVVGTVLIGLGVMPQTGSTAFDDLVNSCVSYLSSAGAYVVDGMVNVARVISGQKVDYAVAQDLIDVIRSWLFNSGTLTTVTSISGADIAVTTCNTVSSGSMNRSIRALVDDSPANALSLFEGLGVYKNVFIYSFDESYLYGFYFSPLGILSCAAFTNPLGVANASLFGTYSVSELSLDYGQEILEVHGRITSYTSSYSYPYPIFYNSYYLQSHPDYLTMDAMVFDWSSVPSINSATTGSSYPVFKMFTKSSKDTVISELLSTRGFANVYDAGYYINAFTWDTATYTTVSTSADVVLGSVATEDETTLDGYATWAAGAVTYPGTSDSEGDESEEIHKYWPVFLPNTYEDLSEVTQNDVWTGESTSTGTDTGTGTLTGTFADTAVGSFIKSLIDGLVNAIKSLFVPAEGYIESKVEALTAKYSFAELIASNGMDLLDFIKSLGSQPPIIYIDLSASRGSFYLGGKEIFVDLTWYSEYKPTVDWIVSAFIWLWFVWRVFLSLPGIISGTSGFWGPPKDDVIMPDPHDGPRISRR